MMFRDSTPSAMVAAVVCSSRSIAEGEQERHARTPVEAFLQGVIGHLCLRYEPAPCWPGSVPLTVAACSRYNVRHYTSYPIKGGP